MKVLCGQEYNSEGMQVAPCTRCRVGWSRSRRQCEVATGCEHLPLVSAADVPECPIQPRCQHQIQAGTQPCPVRARGMICESALRLAGIAEPESHPLGFSAETVVSPEEWVSR